ncbi:hypothetical protein B5K05_29815 [Rhizobium phaseoli]|nr:hypothetical protein B5K05_29815 [Rhizobium phaseoli]RDJ03096.1 hypothetical protein B5K04_27185 [Rhizobium phaseoli]
MFMGLYQKSVGVIVAQPDYRPGKVINLIDARTAHTVAHFRNIEAQHRWMGIEPSFKLDFTMGQPLHSSPRLLNVDCYVTAH